jgi:hypothetical protein
MTRESDNEKLPSRSISFVKRFRTPLLLFFASILGVILSIIATRSNPALTYKTYDRPTAKIHTLQIPANSGYRIDIATADRLETVRNLAEKNDALAAINAGFFDPNNGQTTSFIVRGGKLIADPRKNARFINNPDLQPYLSRMLNRGEWRQYRCRNGEKFSIAFHADPIPSGCEIRNSIGAGPRLLPRMTAREEAFTVSEKGRVIRDSIGVNQRNARSAIGITGEGNLILVMVERKTPNGGLSLPELASFLTGLGVVEALNLDGGSSSSFYYQGISEYGQTDKNGAPVKRPIKSALILRKSSR